MDRIIPYLVLLGLIVGGGVGVYKHIQHLEEENVQKDRAIENLSVEIQHLIQKNRVVGFEKYFEGYDENITLPAHNSYTF